MQLKAADLKYVWLGIMTVLLLTNASAFVQSGEQKSNYDAPWVHPRNIK
jgi:hypothetical protein